MSKRGKALLCIILICICCLSGCGELAGSGLFGETHFTEQKAQDVLVKVKKQMHNMDFSKYAFSLEVYKDTSERYDIYWSEAYVVASAGEKDNYLWYQDYLYADIEDGMYYNQVSWEEIGWKEVLDSSQTYILQLLQQEGKLTYKKVPIAGDDSYLLTVDYSKTEYLSEGRDVYPTLRIWVNEKAEIISIILSWNEPGIEAGTSVKVFFSPYENSTDYQAERKVWRFAHDYGLVEEVVPSLNIQEDDREYCEKIINGIDFAFARNSWQYDEKLHFPEIIP